MNRAVLTAIVAFVLLAAPQSFAACTNPPGVEGETIYNGNQNVHQICTGTDWVALGVLNPGAGGSGCTSPDGTEGEIIYNANVHKPQYCDGDDWRVMIGTVGGGDGGSVPYCWGTGSVGRLGYGGNTNQTKPKRLAANFLVSSTKGPDAGNLHACALQSNGDGYCWGDGDSGQLGNGTNEDHWAPTLIQGMTWESLDVGWTHTCGLTNSGDAYCWGDDAYGQLGNGATTGTQNTPSLVAGGHQWVAISAGYRHSCGITDTGAAYCWGEQQQGRLGNGSDTSAVVDAPTQVLGGHTWTAISSGRLSTCGITNTGDAYCWGYNVNGQTGSGTTSGSESTPVLVADGHTWTAISVGYLFACGITNAGAAYCWGSDTNGELGNGATTGDQPSPVTLSGGYTWTAIDAAYQHACGITETGAAYCWGQQQYGRLGNGNDGSATVDAPALVLGDHSWTGIRAGYQSSCGITG